MKITRHASRQDQLTEIKSTDDPDIVIMTKNNSTNFEILMYSKYVFY